MNEALYSTLHLDVLLPRADVLALVAELAHGAADERGVDVPWGRIRVDDSDGMFEIWQRDPDDFLGWRVSLEIMPATDASADVVVPAVGSLMRALQERGIRVVAVADYVDDLPGHGELMGPTSPPTLSWDETDRDGPNDIARRAKD
jgi:hypothetical protein